VISGGVILALFLFNRPAAQALAGWQGISPWWGAALLGVLLLLGLLKANHRAFERVQIFEDRENFRREAASLRLRANGLLGQVHDMGSPERRIAREARLLCDDARKVVSAFGYAVFKNPKRGMEMFPDPYPDLDSYAPDRDELKATAERFIESCDQLLGLWNQKVNGTDPWFEQRSPRVWG